MIEIEINGEIINTEPGQMVINVADNLGFEIPRFCYHKNLSVAANCRMCLVEIEGAPKPQPACSTPIAPGMKVKTNSQKAKDAQKAVMDFLLINHPLDCPICDQGGECELQDVAMEYGNDSSKFYERKRIITDKDIGPLIQTEMTRCIHCTRCVRFGQEVAGIMEMGGTGRGEHLKIEPFLDMGIDSELSGNMIDVCPVGALTSKPFRFELRSWQMQAQKNVARHDTIGSNIYVQTFKNDIKRVVARENNDINQTWISDRDRFSYEGLNSNRLLKPQVKKDGNWQECEWSQALELVTENLLNTQGDDISALCASSASLEEFFLLRKLAQGLGSKKFSFLADTPYQLADLSIETNIDISEIEKLDNILIVGSNPRLEEPMLNHRLRKAALNGAKINFLNVKKFDLNFAPTSYEILSPNAIVELLKNEASDVLKDLASADNSAVIIGPHLKEHTSNALNLIKNLAVKTKSKIVNLTQSANSSAAIITGCVSEAQVLSNNTKSAILLDIEPQFDLGANEKKILKKSFTISLNSFATQSNLDFADVILPIASFYESGASFVNLNRQVQFNKASVAAPGDAKPAWKVLKVIADLLNLKDFNYLDVAQVHDAALKDEVSFASAKFNDNEIEAQEVQVINLAAPYAKDSVLRNTNALKKTKVGQFNNAWLNSKTGEALKKKDGAKINGANVVIDENVADDCVFIYSNVGRE